MSNWTKLRYLRVRSRMIKNVLLCVIFLSNIRQGKETLVFLTRRCKITFVLNISHSYCNTINLFIKAHLYCMGTGLLFLLNCEGPYHYGSRFDAIIRPSTWTAPLFRGPEIHESQETRKFGKEIVNILYWTLKKVNKCEWTLFCLITQN